MISHASLPIAEHLYDNKFRIYFSTRNLTNRSYTGYVTIDINEPQKILEMSDHPVLVPGKAGDFDDSGAMATWLTTINEQRYMYYIGWNLGVTVPFRNSIGLAVSNNHRDFVRYAPGPILDRSMREPYFCASCCVLPTGSGWAMWYLSCTGWDFIDGTPRHRYHIKYADSTDAINWNRNQVVAIECADKDEYAISRPSVIKDQDGWRMWYSCRGDSYRIGYAESADGVSWSRLDHEVGIDVSAYGWDAEMIEYPFVFDHQGNRYMLYNGNGYGHSGFGIAILESD